MIVYINIKVLNKIGWKKTMSKKTKCKKGEYKYINSRKKAQLFMTLFYVMIGIIIFLIGLLLNKYESKNIFSIIAVLMVLPAAKRLVNFIVFLPFSSVEEELYKKAQELKEEGDTFYTDVVFTSPEKIMYLAFLVVAGNELIGLLGNKKQDEAYIDTYLKNGIKKRELPYKLTIVRDSNDFLKKYKKADRTIERTAENNEQLTSYLYSLIVK